MTNIDNKIENKTIEETLNEVKNNIINGTITKEQSEMMIKKCDILIKKNKKNLDRMEKMNALKDVQSVELSKEKDIETPDIQEVAESYWEEEILDKMVMCDDRIGDDVRITITEWFACRLEEFDDNVYIQKENDLPECIYFFDEEDLLRGMAVRYNNMTQVVKDLDNNYERIGSRQMWYDKRLDMDVTICGNWLVHEFEHGYCKYAEVIKKLELR